MKKFMSSMAIIIAVLLASFAVSACETTKSTDEKYFTFEYVEATDSYVVAASELELPKTVFIPAEYEGKPVTAVKEGGFSGENCFALTDVVVRQQAAFGIGVGAFAGLKNLRSCLHRSCRDQNLGNENLVIFEFNTDNIHTVEQALVEDFACGNTFLKSFGDKRFDILGLTLLDFFGNFVQNYVCHKTVLLFIYTHT